MRHVAYDLYLLDDRFLCLSFSFPLCSLLLSAFQILIRTELANKCILLIFRKFKVDRSSVHHEAFFVQKLHRRVQSYIQLFY